MATTFNLILIGKTGNGKSATGNSILGKNAFVTQSSCSSEVSKPSAGSSLIYGTQVTVVDGLNFCNSEEKADFTDVEQALRLCENEFSALLVVLKFGSRFGEEDMKVVTMAKTVFGEDVLKDFGICVLTHGGNFCHAVEEEGEFLYIHEWFEQQTGKVQELFSECGKRCVLFDNITKSAQEKEKQFSSLLCMVNQMPRRYTLQDFKDAGTIRKSLVGNELVTELKIKSEQLLRSVREELQTLENDGSERASDFEVLVTKLQNQILLINKTLGENSKYSRELTISMTAVSMEIESKIRGMTRTETMSTNKTCFEVVTAEHISFENSETLKDYEHMKLEMIQFEKHAQRKLKDWIKKLNTILWKLDEGSEGRKTVAKDLKMLVLKMEKFNKTCGGDSREIQSSLNKICEDVETGKEISQIPQTDMDKFEANQSISNNEINLLLFGKSGNGKSSTGNSILGRKAFKTNSSTTSSVDPIMKESSLQQNTMVNVVDGPGVDTSQDGHEALVASLNNFKDSLELCDYQFSALVLVLQYGVPFTKQEIDTTRMIRGVLGNDVIKKFGVCIITRGDSFEYDMHDAETPLSFEEWCRQQRDELGGLFEECNFRCVLFNNKTSDQTVGDQQVQRLLSFVRPGVMYSKADFKKGFRGLKEHLWKNSISVLIQKSTQYLNEMRQRITDNARLKASDKDAYIGDLKKILGEIEEYRNMIHGSFTCRGC